MPDLLEDIQSHDNGNPKELSDLNLLLEVTAAICHQLDVLQENQTPMHRIPPHLPHSAGRATVAGLAAIFAHSVDLEAMQELYTGPISPQER